MNSNFKLTINDTAIARISKITKDKPKGTFLRIQIESGGCSGFSTSFILDTKIDDEDLIIEREDIQVVINKEIASFIKEAELRFHSDILSSYFMLDVKTAVDKCSCGSSFGV